MSDSLYSVTRGLPALALRFDQPEVCASGFPEGSRGELRALEGWSGTAPVDLSGLYGIAYELHASFPVLSAAFFDADGKFLSGIGISGGHPQSGRTAALTGFAPIPAGAAFARFAKYAGSDRRFPIPFPFACGIPDRAAFDALAARFPFHDKKIACVGDSLTEGDYGYRYGVGYIYGYNFPFFLGRKLGCHVDNYGVCGATSTSSLGYFTNGSYPVGDADVITVMLGTNHGLGGQLGADYRALLDGLEARKKPGAKIVLITPPHVSNDPRRRSDDLKNTVAAAAETVRRLAAERGLVLIDALADGPLQDENEDILQSNDGVHMTEAGYRAFAGFVADQLIGRGIL